jgi:hypothetical protein
VRRTRDARLLAASLVSLCAAVGCPVFLSDDFKTVPAATPDGGDTADGGAGGAGGTSGAPGGGGVVSGGGTGAMITNPSAGTTGTDAAAGGGTPGSDDGGFGANSAAGGAAGSGAGGAGNSDAGTCAGCDPRWTPTAPPEAAFAAREQAAYTAAGTRVFIWGGADRAGSELATGALYDAELDGRAGGREHAVCTRPVDGGVDRDDVRRLGWRRPRKLDRPRHRRPLRSGFEEMDDHVDERRAVSAARSVRGLDGLARAVLGRRERGA